MSDLLAAIAFIVISFLTGLSIAFNICSALCDEKDFFESRTNAIMLYIIGTVMAISFTVLSYYGICFVQKVYYTDWGVLHK
jgi:hypothetical protein